MCVRQSFLTCTAVLRAALRLHLKRPDVAHRAARLRAWFTTLIAVNGCPSASTHRDGGIRSMATLPGSSACVMVGRPLSASESLGSTARQTHVGSADSADYSTPSPLAPTPVPQ
jgi:hypothetical protein